MRKFMRKQEKMFTCYMYSNNSFCLLIIGYYVIINQYPI